MMNFTIHISGKIRVLALLISVTSIAYNICAQKNIGSVYAKLNHASEDSIFIELHNESSDSIYLFSTYLPHGYKALSDNNHSLSEYLHRFNPEDNKYLLSFIPIKNLLFFGNPDVVYIGKDAVLKGSLGYSFEIIIPYSYMLVALPTASIYSNEYVEEFYPWKGDYNPAKREKYKKMLAKLKRYKLDATNCIYVEFAIFLKDSLPYITKERRINNWTQETLNDYIKISLPIFTNTHKDFEFNH